MQHAPPVQGVDNVAKGMRVGGGGVRHRHGACVAHGAGDWVVLLQFDQFLSQDAGRNFEPAAELLETLRFLQ